MSGIVYACIAPHPPITRPRDGPRPRAGDAPHARRPARRWRRRWPLPSRRQSSLVSPHGPVRARAVGILTSPRATAHGAAGTPRMSVFDFENDLDAVALIQEEADARRSALIPIEELGRRDDPRPRLGLHRPAVLSALRRRRAPRSSRSRRPSYRPTSTTPSAKRSAAPSSASASAPSSSAAPTCRTACHPALPAATTRPASSSTQTTRTSSPTGTSNWVLATTTTSASARLRTPCPRQRCSWAPSATSAASRASSPTRGRSASATSWRPSTSWARALRRTREAEAGYRRDTKRRHEPTIPSSSSRRRPSSATCGRQGCSLSPTVASRRWKGAAGVFVSIKKCGDLRGCIGTIEPIRDNVGLEIIHNAIAAAVATRASRRSTRKSCPTSPTASTCSPLRS